MPVTDCFVAEVDSPEFGKSVTELGKCLTPDSYSICLSNMELSPSIRQGYLLEQHFAAARLLSDIGMSFVVELGCPRKMAEVDSDISAIAVTVTVVAVAVSLAGVASYAGAVEGIIDTDSTIFTD